MCAKSRVTILAAKFDRSDKDSVVDHLRAAFAGLRWPYAICLPLWLESDVNLAKFPKAEFNASIDPSSAPIAPTETGGEDREALHPRLASTAARAFGEGTTMFDCRPMTIKALKFGCTEN